MLVLWFTSYKKHKTKTICRQKNRHDFSQKRERNNYATLCLSHPGCRTCRQTCISSSALPSLPASLEEWCITCTGTQEIPSHTREFNQGIERRHCWRHGSWHAHGSLLLYFRLCYLCSWFWTTEWYHSEADSSSLWAPGFSITITSAPVALIPPPSIVPVRPLITSEST